jgi:hypothetical protein
LVDKGEIVNPPILLPSLYSKCPNVRQPAQERVAYYRSETLRKIAETAGPGSNAPLESMHQEEQIDARHRRETIRLGSLITIAVGIGLMIFLRGIAPEKALYLVGLIPLLIGVA